MPGAGRPSFPSRSRRSHSRPASARGGSTWSVRAAANGSWSGVHRGGRKDILAGVRVTGREQGLNFRLMDVQMYDDRALGAKNLSVGRVSANVLDESNAGLIFTHGDPGTTGDNSLVGGDFNYRASGV